MAPVQLYVYDLSRGMAKQMSLALTGKQIDGIWHTSVVVYGREVFYGQGILESRPGATHHGQPVQVLDMGETQIDESTFDEYLHSLAELYTAESYHLIEFNCNNFTADVIGFLTGRETPTWITGLPAEFLATPFGQMLKPQIDSMFRSRSSAEHRVNPGLGPSTPAEGSTPARVATPPRQTAASGSSASSLLNSIASAATTAPCTSSPLASSSSSTAASSATAAPAAPASPLTLVTSSTNFQSLLKSHHLLVNFTNTPGCPPCRVIKPIYESIAASYTSYASRSPGLRFVEVELGVGEGRDIASKYGVSATPTFMFFRSGTKVDELRGAGKKELETRIEAFVEETWPRHLHRIVYLPAVEGLPISAITVSSIPNYAALTSKLEGYLGDGGKAEMKVIKEQVVPLLQDKRQATAFAQWVQATQGLLGIQKPEESFPILDLWRIGALQPAISTQLVTSPSLSPIDLILRIAGETLSSRGTETSKPYLLTLLRLLTNLLASLPIANVLLAPPHLPHLITITVDSLLHAESTVRSAAAGLAVNLANYRHRLARSLNMQPEEMQEADWETELLTALIEAVGREADEDVCHRLLVAIAQVMYLNKGIEGMKEMMEVLEAKQTIQGKRKGWTKKDVKKLADEVVEKLI